MPAHNVLRNLEKADASGDTTDVTYGGDLTVDLTTTLTGAVTCGSTLAVTGATTHTGAVTNSSTVATTGATTHTGGTQTLMIAVPDGTTYTVLAANSGKVHIIPDLTGDCVLTLPTAAAGLFYEFWYAGVLADAQDWQFDTGSDTNFYLGGFVELDASGNTVVAEAPDGDSNSIVNILTPGVGTIVKMYCDGTNWYLSGTVQSDTADAVTWADQ
jgi:hypothetical protein